MIEEDRVVSGGSQRDDEAYDRAVRPKTLADYVGQPAVKAQMDLVQGVGRCVSGLRTRGRSDLAQVQALVGISRYLSQAEQREVLKDTLACARRIPGNKARAEALLDMAEYLPEGERTQVFTEALSAARKVRGNFGAEALVDLAMRLPEGQRRSALEEALVTARGMGPYSKDRAWTMARISTQLPETERGEVLAEALSSARRVEDEGFESKMLADLIPLI